MKNFLIIVIGMLALLVLGGLLSVKTAVFVFIALIVLRVVGTVVVLGFIFKLGEMFGNFIRK